jgi:UDP-N-acetylmuramoyl-tripeptide--D-alanyl-D-alanine ligase
VGRTTDADYEVSDVALDAHLRSSFSLLGQRFEIGLHGEHHVMNAAMAAALAHAFFAMPLEEIAVELRAVASGRWRMELSETDDGVVVLNDAYNANPTSMDAALVALAHLPVRGRRIAVLGEMRELGTHAAAAHREAGERAAALGIDLLVAVGTGGAMIADAARARGAAVELADDAADAIRLVDATARPGDAVLCKASRAIGLERVAEEILARRRMAGAP